ncbi:MAG: AmmeMemoRadiSam system protein B [Bacteroidales bacterium]|nr:AmmeMemoRadiSam system protein B [Bacteroidales bacterium]
MNKKIKIFLINILILSFLTNCNSQEKDMQREIINREAVAAGRFYQSDAKKLKRVLSDLFKKAVPKKYKNVLAVISPHAGYPYSGEVAASAFNQIDWEKNYENIFIIASSHQVSFSGASIYNKGNYLTPMGEVKVDFSLADKLINENDIFTFNSRAHANEHSLEVQLPFLQYKLKKDNLIVPIVIGTQDPAECKKIAEALKPYFNNRSLFIISSDFSHYPKYEDAVSVDKRTADAICSNSVKELHNILRDNNKMGIRDLATSLCGWSSVYTLLYLTKNNDEMVYSQIQYMNSGDATFGDKSSVVGYYAISVHDKNITESSESGYYLNKTEKISLLKIARNTIEKYISEGKIPEIDPGELTDKLKEQCGAFVTLHKNKRLRGCIGRFVVSEPLYKIVQQMAIEASVSDNRFPKVTTDEINELEIEISVLTPMKKIDSIDEIELGKHGIYIKKGFSSGTFLPQVATETGWTKEEFLGHCARDKARIGWNGWKDAEVFVYEALVFGEEEME